MVLNRQKRFTLIVCLKLNCLDLTDDSAFFSGYCIELTTRPIALKLTILLNLKSLYSLTLLEQKLFS